MSGPKSENNAVLNGRVAHIVEHIRPGGGPSGYLYNLSSVADKHPERLFDILYATRSEERSHWKGSARFELILKILRAVSPVFREFLLLLIQGWNRKRQPRFVFSPEFTQKLNHYTCLVFHDVFKARIYADNFSIKGQGIFVMPHSPSDISMESIEDYENFLGVRLKNRYYCQKCSLRKSICMRNLME
ncbi:hypothetical protein ACFSC4_10590 [Deinococcus malanensis]|uniref:hypothetical protein n=1 Tax=Deinococcus malanensis TaxID=1706855 RepID=UPI00363BDE3B